jgi:putative NADH-flavin reductase
MRIAVFGATGRTGRYVVEQALARGHKVIAFARSPEKLKIDNPDLEILEGDVAEADRVNQAIAGAEAVISTMGPTQNKPTFAVSKGTDNIVGAMAQHGVQRLVISAGAGVRDPKDSPRLINRFFDLLVRLFSRWVFEDMKRAVEIVRQSGLEWTVVRVPMLTDDQPTGEVNAAYVGRGMGMRVTRADLASFMLDQLEDETYVHQAPAISSQKL